MDEEELEIEVEVFNLYTNEEHWELVEEYWDYVEDYYALLVENGDGGWDEEELFVDRELPPFVDFGWYQFPEYSDGSREIDCMELKIENTGNLDEIMDQLIEMGTTEWPEI